MSEDILTLVITRKCNLRCTHCLIRKSSKSMPWETLHDALVMFLSWVRNHRQADCSIKFFGGEPVLEFGLIRRAVAFVRGTPSVRRVRFQLPTNGTCLTKDRLNFLRRHPDIEVSVSRIRNPGGLKILPNLVVNVSVFPKRVSALPGYTAWLLGNGFKRINILPAYFCRWGSKELNALRKALEIVALMFVRHKDAMLENIARFGPVPLFNSGWAVDTDGFIYSSNMFLAKPFEKAMASLRIGHVSDGCLRSSGRRADLNAAMKRCLPPSLMDSTIRVDSILNDFVGKVKTLGHSSEGGAL